MAALAAAPLSTSGRAQQPVRRPSLTDIDGLLVGHFTHPKRPTGCTVVTSRNPFTAGVDVRGLAPGTRETDLLRPEKSVDRVHAILLTGGSAFGLDAATGVMRWLEEQGRGLDVEVARVPIVPAAVIFDLRLGDARIRPDAAAGYEAVRAAGTDPVVEGSVGAGAGATVGKMFGMARAMKSGLGSWSLARADGLKVAALVAVNCIGDVIDPARGAIVAGARSDGGGFLDIAKQLREGRSPWVPLNQNTVIGVVATNATLSKQQCSSMAQLAHDALARTIRPAHTQWDGDTVFSVATGTWSPKEGAPDAALIGELAADALATAILRGVSTAESYRAYPAARDYPRKR
jgi:L-aminopeptidase/D-esterase-like protein